MTTSATPLTAGASVRARRSTGTRIGLRRLSLVGGLLLCAAAGSPAEAGAQDERPTKPLIVYLDRDHTRFLKFGALVQIWARHTQMNPGSKLSEGGLVQDAATDVSVRRFRVSMDAQLSERTMGFFQLGVNNLNYISGRGAAVELLDAYASVRRCCSSAGNWCAAPTARADW